MIKVVKKRRTDQQNDEWSKGREQAQWRVRVKTLRETRVIRRTKASDKNRSKMSREKTWSDSAFYAKN